MKNHIRTLTMDNGREFCNHVQFGNALDAKTYFTHPHSSWENKVDFSRQTKIIDLQVNQWIAKQSNRSFGERKRNWKGLIKNTNRLIRQYFVFAVTSFSKGNRFYFNQ